MIRSPGATRGIPVRLGVVVVADTATTLAALDRIGARPAVTAYFEGGARAATVTAWLLDLINRGHVAMRTDDQDWRLVRLRPPGERDELPDYEQRCLRELFGRRGRRLSKARLLRRLWYVRSTSELLAGEAGAVLRVPGTSDAVRRFRDQHLLAVEPSRLDPVSRDDYLPYVLALGSPRDVWPRWGLDRVLLRPRDGADVDYPLLMAANVLHDAIGRCLDEACRQLWHRPDDPDQKQNAMMPL